MRFRNAFPASLAVMLAAFVPSGTIAAGSTASFAPIAISVSAVRSDAVRVVGTVPGAHQLSAVLSAALAPELPVVLIDRRPLATDAGGHFDAILPVAPAFFTGAIIIVSVETAAGVRVARGSTLDLVSPTYSR
jgi:hypothetical protein